MKGYKLNNKGATMMVAVVIIGILMVFTFSLLLVSYTLYASQSKKAASLRNAEAATSLSRALETELTVYSTVAGKENDPEKNSALWKYLRCNIAQGDNWPYYDPAAPGHDEEYAFRYFDVKYGNNTLYEVTEGLDGYPADVKLCVYWMLPQNSNEEIFYNSGAGCTNPSNVRLFIDIITETASQTYVIKNEYRLTATPYDTNDVVERNKMASVSSLFSGKSPYNPNGIPSGSGDPLKWKWSFIGRE